MKIQNFKQKSSYSMLLIIRVIQVLDVIVNKDQRGRKAVEYLIHFQVNNN